MEITSTKLPLKPTEASDLSNYELAYWLESSLSPEERRSIQERIAAVIRELGGEVERESEPELRNLAYPIRNHSEGYFVAIGFKLSPEGVGKIERELRESEVRLLRYLVVKQEPRAKIVSQELAPELVRVFRPDEIAKLSTSTPARDEVETGSAPLAPKPKVSMEEIEKKLEELLG